MTSHKNHVTVLLASHPSISAWKSSPTEQISRPLPARVGERSWDGDCLSCLSNILLLSHATYFLNIRYDGRCCDCLVEQIPCCALLLSSQSRAVTNCHTFSPECVISTVICAFRRPLLRPSSSFASLSASGTCLFAAATWFAWHPSSLALQNTCGKESLVEETKALAATATMVGTGKEAMDQTPIQGSKHQRQKVLPQLPETTES